MRLFIASAVTFILKVLDRSLTLGAKILGLYSLNELKRLHSASSQQFLVLRYQLSSLGRRSFAVAGPTTWNSLSADLRDPTCSDKSFRRSLKFENILVC